MGQQEVEQEAELEALRKEHRRSCRRAQLQLLERMAPHQPAALTAASMASESTRSTPRNVPPQSGVVQPSGVAAATDARIQTAATCSRDNACNTSDARFSRSARRVAFVFKLVARRVAQSAAERGVARSP